MHTYRNSLFAAVVVLMQVFSTQALARDISAVEGQKSKIVFRLYQATYGAQLRCSDSPEWAHLGKTLDRFRSTYPELIQLVDKSRYFTAAKENFQGFMIANPTSKMSEKNLTKECETLESILRSLIDAPGGNDAVAGYVQQLKAS